MASSNDSSKRLFNVFLLLLAGVASWMIISLPSGNEPAARATVGRKSVSVPTAATSAAASAPKAQAEVSADVESDGTHAGVGVQMETREPDPYAWLADPPGNEPIPPLNIVIQCHTGSSYGSRRVESFVMEHVFAKARSSLRIKTCIQDLTPEGLRNANLLLLMSDGRRGSYSPEERKVLRAFLEDGGNVFVIYIHGGEAAVQDILDDYGVSIRKGYPDDGKALGLKFTPPAFAERPVDETTLAFNPLVCAKDQGWQPLIVQREHADEIALATRRVGKGRLVVASNRCVLGRSSSPHRLLSANVDFLGRVFDACARTGRRVDPYGPYKMIALLQSPVLLTSSNGVRIAAVRRLESGARGVRDFLDRWIPAMERRMGPLDLPRPWKDVLLVASAHVHGGVGLGYIYDDAQGPFHARYVWAASPDEIADAISDGSWHWITALVRWEAPGNRSEVVGYENFDCALRRSLVRLVLEDAGFGEAARRARAQILEGARKVDPDLCQYWADGMPRDPARPRIDNPRVLTGLFRAKVEALLQDLLKERSDFVARLLLRKREMTRRGRIRGDINYSQTAALFSHALERDCFQLFEKYGFRVDRREARFGRSAVDLKLLEPVRGKSAITGTKYNSFTLQKAEGKRPAVELELIGCPAGTAEMGRGLGWMGAVWRHDVAVSEDFYLGKFPVTKRQWAAVMGDRKRSAKEAAFAKALAGGDAAADHLSQTEVLAFCAKLTERFHYRIPPGYVFRPPTELEWEYACRAGDAPGPYCGLGQLAQEDIRKICWTPDDSVRMLLAARVKLPKDLAPAMLPRGPVGRKAPNAWGFHDFYGLGWEYCLDTFGPLNGQTPVELMKTPDGRRRLFAYQSPVRDNKDFHFSYAGRDAHVCVRGLDYAGPESLTKTVVPVDGAPSAEMTFRVCLGPDLAADGR